MSYTHKIMIEQGSGEKSAWKTLKLSEREAAEGKSASGKWTHFDNSGDSDSDSSNKIRFTSAHNDHLYWQWSSTAPSVMTIGVKMARASHRSDEKEDYQILITLNNVSRSSNGQFGGAGKNGAGSGSGLLTYDVNPHFKKGAIEWTVVRY